MGVRAVQRRRIRAAGIAAVVVTVAASYVLARAYFESRDFGDGFFDGLRIHALQAFVAAWLFFFGATIGSFMNVVVYRMPRGESVVWRPSRCPWCDVPIKGQDNIPVFGWLVLGGRCRACRLSISPRYPLIEAAVGAVFLGHGIVELFSAAGNLPTTRPHLTSGMIDVLFAPMVNVIALYSLHVALLAVLVTITLIEFDGFRAPLPVLLFGLALGLAAPVLWIWAGTDHFSQPIPVPALAEPPGWLPKLPYGVEYLSSLAGALAGFILGSCAGLVDLILKRRRQTAPNDIENAAAEEHRAVWWPVTAVFGMVGLFLGWQAVTVIFAIASGVLLLAAICSTVIVPLRKISWGAALLIACLLHISLWRWLTAFDWWPGGTNAPFWTAAPCIVAALLFTVAARLMARRPRPVSTELQG